MLTTNAARETHKHLNIRLTRRTIASEISGSSGSSEYDAAADIVEEWQRIESAASSSDVIVENLCSTPGSPAGDEPASKNTAIRHVAAIRQNKVQPTDSSEGVASISATPMFKTLLRETDLRGCHRRLKRQPQAHQASKSDAKLSVPASGIRCPRMLRFPHRLWRTWPR